MFFSLFTLLLDKIDIGHKWENTTDAKTIIFDTRILQYNTHQKFCLWMKGT